MTAVALLPGWPVDGAPAAFAGGDVFLARRGEALLASGRVAVVVRVGPPADYAAAGAREVVDGRSLLQMRVDDAREAARVYGAPVPVRAWCPPGGAAVVAAHARARGLVGDDFAVDEAAGDDLIAALRATGVLDDLLARGATTILCGDVANLGATIDATLLGLFDRARAERGVGALVEVGDDDDAPTGTVVVDVAAAAAAGPAPVLPVRVPRAGPVGRFRAGRSWPMRSDDDVARVRALLRESPVFGAAAPTRAGDAQRLAALLAELRLDAGTARAPRCFSAPGRVNLIGEHVDHQDGLALPAAVHLGVLVASQRRDDDVVSLRSLSAPERVRFAATDVDVGADPTWGRYAKAVVAALHERGRVVVGFDAVLDSTLPPGSGMSSSTALCLAIAAAATAHAGAPAPPAELIGIAQRAEHLVGVLCGNLDQAAIVHGVRDHAVLLDCRTLAVEPVPLHLGDHVIVVGDTGKPRGLVDSQYNERRAQCEAAAAALGVRSLRDATLAAVAALDGVLAKRARHVVTEIERVRAFVAIARGDDADRVARLGALMDQSHASLRDDFECSCRELDALVALTRAHAGVAGARMMGGGFGGCIVALVPWKQVARLIKDVGRAYQEQIGLPASFYVVVPDDGLREIAFSAAAASA